MLKKDITFNDYNGTERTIPYYFNLSEAEVTLMEAKYPGGFSSKLQRISESKDNNEIIGAFEDFIDKSVGEKSEDGLYFFKSPEIIARFKASPAYNILIIELLSDATKAAAFINGIFPESISEKIYQK